MQLFGRSESDAIRSQRLKPNDLKRLRKELERDNE